MTLLSEQSDTTRATHYLSRSLLIDRYRGLATCLYIVFTNRLFFNYPLGEVSILAIDYYEIYAGLQSGCFHFLPACDLTK